MTRLCYCGPVLHTLPVGPWGSREPLQFGAEIYGHAGLEADLEALELAIDALKLAGVKDVVVDLSDARVQRSVIRAVTQQPDQQQYLSQLLVAKDQAGIQDKLQTRFFSSVLNILAALDCRRINFN